MARSRVCDHTSRVNTVHLIILMALQMSILGRGLTWRGRSGKLLILRLTPRWRRRAPAVAHSPEATRPAPSAVTPNSCCGQNGGPTPPAHSRRNDTAMWLRLWLPSFQQGTNLSLAKIPSAFIIITLRHDTCLGDRLALNRKDVVIPRLDRVLATHTFPLSSSDCGKWA